MPLEWESISLMLSLLLMSRFQSQWRITIRRVEEQAEMEAKAIVSYISDPLIEKSMTSLPQILPLSKTIK